MPGGFSGCRLWRRESGRALQKIVGCCNSKLVATAQDSDSRGEICQQNRFACGNKSFLSVWSRDPCFSMPPVSPGPARVGLPQRILSPTNNETCFVVEVLSDYRSGRVLYGLRLRQQSRVEQVIWSLLPCPAAC